jgi:CBS domain-containing protein
MKPVEDNDSSSPASLDSNRANAACTDYLPQLIQHPPFSQMRKEDVAALVGAATESRYTADEVILSPDSGGVSHVCVIYRGEVSAHKGIAAFSSTGFHYETGDMFPVSAALGSRPVTATYTATTETTCLQVPLPVVEKIAQRSPPFASFITGKTLQLLELSRRATQAAYSAQALAALSLERKLRELPSKPLATCGADARVEDVLRIMQQQRVGSVIVTRTGGEIEGIFTRKDVLNRVALPQTPLTSAIAAVMTRDVRTLTVEHTAQDAALLMSRFAIRHVPVLDNARVVSVVSERDLFAIQRMSVKQVSSAARTADDVQTLKFVAQDIRVFARALLSQGVHAKSLTELISHLNDVLTARLLEIVARDFGMSMNDMCWLSFGSEGRSEQTISTDQDNGLIFISDKPERDRPKWLAFGKAVNEALDDCGYPLCTGNIMAGNPECCLTLDEWKRRFGVWIEQGTPENLLRANIFFDFRPLAGRTELAVLLRDFVKRAAKDVLRFHKQLADDILRRGAPLNWLGVIHTERIDGRAVVDLKLRGTALFVDVARLQSLALGIPETGTRRRFEAIAQQRSVEPQRAEAWCTAFEFLQMLRLRIQLDREDSPGWISGHPNKIEVAALNEIDRRLLKEAFRIARKLQQRVELDYPY